MNDWTENRGRSDKRRTSHYFQINFRFRTFLDTFSTRFHLSQHPLWIFEKSLGLIKLNNVSTVQNQYSKKFLICMGKLLIFVKIVDNFFKQISFKTIIPIEVFNVVKSVLNREYRTVWQASSYYFLNISVGMNVDHRCSFIDEHQFWFI